MMDSRAITPKWTSNAAVREVIKAAEDPRPVLLTWEIGTSRGAKGGILFRFSRVGDNPLFSSWRGKRKSISSISHQHGSADPMDVP